MSEYSLLTKEQVETSEILKQRGERGEITDFYAILGGQIGNMNGSNGEKYGEYYTRTDYNKSSIYKVNAYNIHNKIHFCAGIDERDCGIRPVIPISYITENYPDIEIEGKESIEFGNYPQTTANVELQKELENAFLAEKLEKTGNTYTTDSQPILLGLFERRAGAEFKADIHEEFEYNGKKYVRAKVNDGDLADEIYEEKRTSNGEKYKEGDYVWVEVEPIKWLKDEKLGVFIAEKILVAGIEYEEKDKWKKKLENDTRDISDILRESVKEKFTTYGVEFETSNIKYFMDKYLSRDIEQNMIRTKSKETIQKQDGTYQTSDAKKFTDEGIATYDKIGGMYQSHLTKEKEIEENENDK